MKLDWQLGKLDFLMKGGRFVALKNVNMEKGTRQGELETGGVGPDLGIPMNEGPVSHAAFFRALLTATACEDVPAPWLKGNKTTGGRGVATSGRNWEPR